MSNNVKRIEYLLSLFFKVVVLNLSLYNRVDKSVFSNGKTKKNVFGTIFKACIPCFFRKGKTQIIRAI